MDNYVCIYIYPHYYSISYILIISHYWTPRYKSAIFWGYRGYSIIPKRRYPTSYDYIIGDVPYITI